MTVKEAMQKFEKVCKENNADFIVAVSDNGIHSAHSVHGKGKIRELVETLKAE